MNKKRDQKKRLNATSPHMALPRGSNMHSQRSYSQDMTEDIEGKDPKTNIKMANKIIVGNDDTADVKTL